MSFEGTSFAPEIGLGGNGLVQHGSDRNLIVEFYTDAEHQAYESQLAGHAIYKDVDMIRIRTPGINGNTFERKVKLKGDVSSPGDPDRFPAQWRAFKEQQEQRPDGFPIEQWPVLSKSMVLNLKAQGIHVLEQIAGLPDVNLGILGMEGRRLRDLAKAFMEQGKNQGALSAALAERDRFREDLEALKLAVASLKDGDTAKLAADLAETRQKLAAVNAENEVLRQAAPPAQEKKKRGRPAKPKDQTNGN